MLSEPLLRVLLVEDNPADARWFQEELRESAAPWCTLMLATTLGAAIDVVCAGGIDAVVLDLSLPDARGTEAIARMRAAAPDVPVVVLTGLDDDQAALRAVKEGVQDYLVKDHVNGPLLARAVRYATERKRADESHRREAVAEHTAQLREQFVAVLGHDLRNPLSSIALSAGLLLKNGDMTPRQLKSVSRIASSADRMGRMIRDLLDFTRTRLGGGYKLSRRTTSLREICRLVVEEMEIVHRHRSILLSADTACWGEWDGDRVSQVASNLLGNALQHSLPDTAVRIALREDGAQAVLEISNHGVPIPAALLPMLFQPFYRVQPNPNGGSAQGLGLGLYIAQQIVLAHGGRIDVRSSDAEGTTFSVVFPKDSKPATGAEIVSS